MGLADLLGQTGSTVGGTVHGVEHWLENQWHNRMVQVSVYAGLVFYLLSNPAVFDFVDKTVKSTLNVSLGKNGQLILHSLVFALFMYFGSRFVLDPALKSLFAGMKGGGTEGVADAE